MKTTTRRTPARPTCIKPPKPHPNTLFPAPTDAPRPTYVPENHHPAPYDLRAAAAASQHNRCPLTESSRLKRTTTIVGVGAAMASAIAGSRPERSVTGL